MDSTGISPLEGIRQAIHESLASLGFDTSDMHEAILIRSGMYCGRRFTCADGSAVWFVEENQIKYYGGSGELIKVVLMPGQPAPALPLRRAA